MLRGHRNFEHATVSEPGFPRQFQGRIGNSEYVQRPLAAAVIGGTVSSTLLTLSVLPVQYPGPHRHTASTPEPTA